MTMIYESPFTESLYKGNVTEIKPGRYLVTAEHLAGMGQRDSSPWIGVNVGNLQVARFLADTVGTKGIRKADSFARKHNLILTE